MVVKSGYSGVKLSSFKSWMIFIKSVTSSKLLHILKATDFSSVNERMKPTKLYKAFSRVPPYLLTVFDVIRRKNRGTTIGKCNISKYNYILHSVKI